MYGKNQFHSKIKRIEKIKQINNGTWKQERGGGGNKNLKENNNGAVALTGRYNEYDGHYPENFNGYKKQKKG